MLTFKLIANSKPVWSVRGALVLLFAAVLVMTACSAGGEPVSGGELQLTFDGESCTYEGPTLLKAGPAALHFYNNSDVVAAVNLVRHTGDETIQDIIDYIGEKPITLDAPSWTTPIRDVWGVTQDGETRIWEGELEPGIHTMACARLSPYGVWFGTGLEVID